MTIQLEPIRSEHFPSILSWVGTYEEMVQWSGPWNFDFPLDEAQLARFFLTEALDGGLKRMQFVALDRDSSRPVGQIGFSRIWPKTRAGHVGPVIVEPALRGRGVGSQMMREILRLGFEQLHLHRIELVVFDFNAPAIACYEAAGFRTEGLLRDIVRVGSDYWHWRAMSVLEHEYAITRGSHSPPQA
jgi:RimJ/RimL family protein N-acetyltransferase